MMCRASTAGGLLLWSLCVCVTALLLLHVAQPASALWLLNIFSSNMVLQRGNATIWGLATPGAAVTVSLDGLVQSVLAQGGSGYWLYSFLGTVNSSGHTLTVSSDNSSIVFSEVAFGDVFLCSGQSNMQINLNFSFGGLEAIAQWPLYAGIRLFNIPQQLSDSPQREANLSFTPDGWMLPSPATLNCGPDCLWNQFSAVCWYAGRDLYDSLNGSVPIGLIHASYGGTAASTWTSNASVLGCGPLPPFPDVSTALRNPPSGAFNAIIHPLLPLSLSAVLWYQGETDAFDWQRYSCSFPILIRDWRAAFQRPLLPFFFVLLAPVRGQQALVDLWQSQLAALELPMTGVASAIVAGDEAGPQGPVHPRNKSIVGHRLSLQLRHQLYQESAVIADGPAVSRRLITAQAQAGGTEVQVLMQYTPGTLDSGLLILPTPGCTSCCSDGTGLLWARLLNSTDTATYLPLVALDSSNYSLSFSFTSAAVFSSSSSSSSSPPGVLIGFQSFPYPECALYNKYRQPALPFMWALELDVQADDGGGGGYSLLEYALLTAAVLAVLLLVLALAVWLWRRSRRLASAEESAPLVSDSRQRSSARLHQPLMQDAD